MRILLGIAALAVLAGAVAACPEQLEGVLVVNIDAAPPPTTSADTVEIAGQVIRSPPSQSITLSVTVTGGAATAVDTTDSFGLFNVRVPLNRGVVNVLTLIAEDSEGTVSQPRQFTVQHTGTPAGSPEF
jgi:hypothetical protein